MLTTAKRLADAATTNNGTLTRNGILTESCDTGSSTCDDNGKQFKGIFMRYLADPGIRTERAAGRDMTILVG